MRKKKAPIELRFKWSVGEREGHRQTRTLYLRRDPIVVGERHPWAEVIEGSSGGWIVRKYKEAPQGAEVCTKERITHVHATRDSPRGEMALMLRMPGAGYALEIAEQLLAVRGTVQVVSGPSVAGGSELRP